MSVLKYKNADGKYVPLNVYNVQPIVPVQTTGNSATDIMSQDAVTKESKRVEDKIPTTLSQLGEDSEHKLVTDTEKSSWITNDGILEGKSYNRTSKGWEQSVGKIYKSQGGDTQLGEVFNDYNNNQAIGKHSHVEGSRNKAETNANNSHVEGANNVVNNPYEHAQGIYNISHVGQTLHSVGCGEGTESKKNAHEITKDGKHYIINIGGYTGKNVSLTDVKDVATVINEKQDKLVGTQTTGQNLKTINGNSLLGTGNIEITGGGGQPAFSVIDGLGSSSTTDALSANQGRLLETKKADKTALEGKADTSYVDKQLGLKADKTALNDKADTSYVDKQLGLKADKTDLNDKADTTYVDEQLKAKADVNTINGQLENKADTTYVNEQLELKANTSYVDKQLGLKADKTDLNDKADTTYVDEQLKAKADVSDLANKADKSDLDSKANTEYVNNQLALKADKSELDKKVNKSDIVNVYKFKGSVGSFAELPDGKGSPEKPSTVEIGDVYNVKDTGMNYAWIGDIQESPTTETGWDALGGTFKNIEIIDGLDSTDTDKALSANQGKMLSDMIGNIGTILDKINKITVE